MGARHFALAAVVTCGICAAQDPLPDYETVLSELVREAGKNNPDLKAADYKARGALQGAKAARSYGPPQVGVEFFQAPTASFPSPLKNQMEIDYSIQQEFPFPGKLTAMGRAEAAKGAMLEAEGKTRGTALSAGIKSGFAELYFIRREQEINAENMALMRFHAEVARARYGSGQDMAADALKAESEIAALLADSIRLLQEENSMTAMLNASAGRLQDTPIPRTAAAFQEKVNFDYPALCSLAVRSRPELAGMRANIDMNHAEWTAAKKEFLPDFMVKGTYKDMREGPEDYWSLMLSVNAPVAFWSFGKYSAAGEQKRFSVLEARAGLENMRNMVFAQIRDAQGRLESAQSRLAVLTEKGLPVAKQALEAALSAYKTGNSGFLMVVDDQKMYFMAKIDLEMAVMERLQALARLEQAVGADPREAEK